MGEIVNLMTEEIDEGEFRADTEQIRSVAWSRYLDLLDDADDLGLTPRQMLWQLCLCWLSDRL